MENLEFATFGGGCFWCLDAVFRRIRGVSKVVSGYTGGDLAYPTYEQICQGNTGHAEVVQIEFHSDVLDFKKLLEIFFSIHDPTTLNKQGADIGTQYRSGIYCHSEQQRLFSVEMIDKLEKSNIYQNAIVTEVLSLGEFYSAELYHQDYFRKNPVQPYCKLVVEPKIRKLYSNWSHLLKMEVE